MLISKSIGPILGKKITYFDRGVPERSCKKMIHFLVSQFHVNLNLNKKKTLKSQCYQLSIKCNQSWQHCAVSKTNSETIHNF